MILKMKIVESTNQDAHITVASSTGKYLRDVNWTNEEMLRLRPSQFMYEATPFKNGITRQSVLLQKSSQEYQVNKDNKTIPAMASTLRILRTRIMKYTRIISDTKLT